MLIGGSVNDGDTVRQNEDIPFILKLKLKFKAFYLNLALALMLQDALIRLTMFGWTRIPGIGTVLRCFV